jgi:hypothetical protein
MKDKQNNKKLLERVIKLHSLYHQGKIPTLPNHEVNPNLDKKGRENYLYFTLPPCLNFQRSSPAMWASALKTYEDPKTNYLFFPEKIVGRKREEVQRDLVKYKLALQRNRHTDIWMAISRTLNDFYKADPRELLRAGKWNVMKIHQIIQKEKKAHFPYLSGPKMSNYWLYILTRYTDAKFTNMTAISIIPDTHVRKCSVKLGLVSEKDGPLEIAELWKKLLDGSGVSPVEMHPVLWNWSRNNFTPAV